jgi:hypothetical protein
MGLVADLSHQGHILVAILCGGGFVLGCALALRRLNGYVWAGLFFGGPVAAVIAYKIINPDPGCTGDCPGQLAWGYLLLFATLAWWAGLLMGLMVAYGGKRGGPTN